MRKFIGLLTLEGLQNPSAIDGWEPLTEQLLLVPGDREAPVRHVRWYWLEEDLLRRRLEALAATLGSGWYAHFWAGEDLCVVLPGRVFWARTSDRETWKGFIASGRDHGLEAETLERLPLVTPDFVREALAAASDDNSDLPWGNPYCCEA